MKSNVLIALASACLLAACSGKPSSGDAEKVLLKKLQKTESTIEVKSFKVNKAYEQEIFGAQLYVVDYDAEISYPNGLNAHCKDEKNRFNGDCLSAGTFGQIIEPGVIQKKKGEISFEKTSEGWKGPDGEFY